MAYPILTCGLILWLATISCHGFINSFKPVDGKAVGDYGCNGLSAPTNGVSGALPKDDFPKSAKLNNDYSLKWNFNSTHIAFQAHVKTTGYIGLGISKNAAMYPSDIVISWVDSSNVVHVTDRHAQRYAIPSMDKHQDVTLLEGKQEGLYTTISFVRALDPCDEEDMAIQSGDNNVIFAYNQADPTSDTDVPFHGFNKGVAQLDLLA